jgi:hypothetical protein
MDGAIALSALEAISSRLSIRYWHVALTVNSHHSSSHLVVLLLTTVSVLQAPKRPMVPQDPGTWMSQLGGVLPIIDACRNSIGTDQSFPYAPGTLTFIHRTRPQLRPCQQGALLLCSPRRAHLSTQ